MIDHIYIISWLGNNDIRDFRLNIHNQQIEYFIKKNFKIVVFAQAYKPEYYYDHKQVSYISSDVVLRPGSARNILLERFYSSNQDMALFADNDSILYHHMQGDNFIDIMNNQFLWCNDIDLFYPVNPQKDNYNVWYNLDPESYKNNLVFRRESRIKGSLFGLRNIKKYYGLEYFFPKDFDCDTETGNMIPGEEEDLGFFLLSNKKGVYQLRSVVLKEMGSSSTWAPFTDDRNKMNQKRLDLLVSRWGKYGLYIGTGNSGRAKDKIMLCRKNMYRYSEKPLHVMVPIKDHELFSFE